MKDLELQISEQDGGAGLDMIQVRVCQTDQFFLNIRYRLV
jgi:hypothetical protein